MVENSIECFYGEYKKSILGKKYSMKLYVYPSYLEGIGFLWYDGELNDEATSFKISLDEFKEISIIDVKGNKGINIKYQLKKSIVSNSEKISIVIMGIEKYQESIDLVEDIQKKYIERIRVQNEIQKKQELEQKKQEQERALRIVEEEKSARKYIEDCYNFHIATNNNPFFELFKEDYQIAVIYIDKERNINFLRVDGINHDESNGVIPFSKIHYYEKAGNIHYASEVNSRHSSYGGSITGSTFSKRATFWSGLLLGPMGMVGGALFSHKPSKIDIPTIDFNISSDIKKIDDRNVMLNYYSDNHKQYIDIELPASIFNFLQTHLLEKKYDIVMELEKKSAVYQATKQIENGSFLSGLILGQNNSEMQENQSSNEMTIFKQKLEKLKLMYDAGILTDNEFDLEKKKLIELI